MHLGHCSWKGVGGHITLFISRAGVGASIFVVDVGGSSWKLEMLFPLSRSELIHFLQIKTLFVCTNGGEHLGVFLGRTGGWIMLFWIASLLFSAHCWWKG